MFEKVLVVERGISRLTRANRYRVGVIQAVVNGLIEGQIEDVQEASVFLTARASRPESLGFSYSYMAGAVTYARSEADWARQKADDMTVDAVLATRVVGRLREKIGRNNGMVSPQDKSRLDEALYQAARLSKRADAHRRKIGAYKRAADLFAAAAACLA